MTQQEYNFKRQKCWEEYLRKQESEGKSSYSAFLAAFDRAYALGKQIETISQEEIDKAAQEHADELRVSSVIPGALVPMLHDIAKSSYLQGAQDFRGKQIETITQEEIEKASVKFADREYEIGQVDWDALYKGYYHGMKDSLGKQEKDAEETPISERLHEEEKSRLEWLYYYLDRAADKQENESVSVAVLFEAMEQLEDIFGIDILTNGHGKPTPKDADTVIQGWAAIDEAYNQCFLHTEKPIQKAQPIADTGDYDTVWDSKGKTYLLDAGLFPNMDSDSEPKQVEIIIKRKKNG